MECMLLFWDELDDLLGICRCLVARAVMRLNLPQRTAGGAADRAAAALAAAGRP
jgi:hypothetical protein